MSCHKRTIISESDINRVSVSIFRRTRGTEKMAMEQMAMEQMAMEQMAMEIMAMEKMAMEIMAICKIWKKWQTYFIL